MTVKHSLCILSIAVALLVLLSGCSLLVTPTPIQLQDPSISQTPQLPSETTEPTVEAENGDAAKFVNATPTPVSGELIVHQGPTATPSVEQPAAGPSPTPIVDKDCFLSFKLTAWQDLDGDGLWGTPEPPLEGAEFQLQGMFAQMWGYPYLSDAGGLLTITAWNPGKCLSQDYTVTAIPPESYKPTTSAVVIFSFVPERLLYEAQFGFQAVSE